MERAYFLDYCGRGPYAELYREHSGVANCIATLRRTRTRVRSLLVLGAATGEVLADFEASLHVRAHGCELSRWAHARIPARYRRRIARGDLRAYVPALARADRRFDLVFCNALIYLEPHDIAPVLAAASRVARWFHFYSSTSESYEPGDRWRVTLRPRAWWRAQFRAHGWAPTRSPYLFRSRAAPSLLARSGARAVRRSRDVERTR